MWIWLKQNSGGISAILNLLTLIVWAFYFQIFLINYRRTTKPKILINRGAGHGIDGKCAVTNMSAEAVYIEAVVVTLKVASADDSTAFVECSLSDLDSETGYHGDPRPLWFQGPLKSGEMIDMGSYRVLLERTLRSDATCREARPEAVREMTVTVAATYIADDRTLGASRTFDIQPDGDRLILVPRQLPTKQIYARSARRKMRRLLERSLERQQAG